MKITKNQLRQIIREELRHVLTEQSQPDAAEAWNVLYKQLHKKANSEVSQMTDADWNKLNDLADNLDDNQKKNALSYNVSITKHGADESDMEVVGAMVPNMAWAAEEIVKRNR